MTKHFKNKSLDRLSEKFKSKIPQVSDGQPLPLRREPKPIKKYPIQALGKILGDSALAVNEVVQAPIALCAQSILAAVSLAAQGHCNVEIDGRTLPISNFFITVGESGERKSAVESYVNLAIREQEKKLSEQYKMEYQLFLEDEQSYKILKDKTLKSSNLDSLNSIKKSVNNLGDLPLAPLLPHLITDDFTYEGLIKLLKDGQPSLGIFTTEGGRIFGGYGFSADQQLKTISGLSNLWDGLGTKSSRSGDGVITVEGKRVTLHTMLQPIILDQILSNQILSAQGFIPRCLITYPESTIGTRLYNETDLHKDSRFIKYNNQLTKLFERKHSLVQDTRNELKPNNIRLNSKAKREWIKFHNEIEKKLSKKYAPIKGFGAKIPEHALRLAASIAIFEQIEIATLSSLHIEYGISLARFYINEMLRINISAIDDPRIVMAEKLLIWLKTQGSEYFYLSKVYQHGPHQLRDSKKTKEIIKILEDHRQIKRMDSMELEGRKRKEVWKIMESE